MILMITMMGISGRRRSNPSKMILGKDVTKMCSNFIEITLRHGCSLANLLHIFRTPFYKDTSGGLFMKTKAQLRTHKKGVSFIHNVCFECSRHKFKGLRRNRNLTNNVSD